MNNKQSSYLKEVQLTTGESGFLINHTQCFSPDDKWLVFDKRNDDSQIISTGTIGIVNVEHGLVKEIYHTQNQSEYGPGVGAATFSPVQDRVFFLHGIQNANKENPYGFTRRSCIGVDIDNPFVPIAMDARDITPPFTEGALRGGTHAHSSSGDGSWISFTYNDFFLEQLSKKDEAIKDLRTVGVMVPGNVVVDAEDGIENFSGVMFSVIITEVTETPQWGSDEIEKAFDETWIGKSGYLRKDGNWQSKAIAFQGHVRDESGKLKTEVFVVDLPDYMKQAQKNKPLQGTSQTRPNSPAGVYQRRITYTKNGVQGPRHWLRSKKDGSLIAFLANDDQGLIQIFGISPHGGEISKLTNNSFSIQGSFNFSPDDERLAYIANNSIYVTDLIKGVTKQLLPQFMDDERPVGGVVWSGNGKLLAYNRYVKTKSGNYLQVFLLKNL